MLSTKIKEKEQPKAREIKHYEEALKRYNDDLKALHEAGLKKLLYEEGLNTSKISRKDMDDIKRIRDKQNIIHQKYQERINKAQQDAQAKIAIAQAEGQEIINKINTDFQEEFKNIQKSMQDLIDKLKAEQGVKKPESEKEEIKEEGDINNGDKVDGTVQGEIKEEEETKK